MPERLDRITIALKSGDVTIDWNTRQALMGRLQELGSRQRIRESIEAVGASRPVELNGGQKAALNRVLVDWSNDGMPAELVALCDALTDEMADDE